MAIQEFAEGLLAKSRKEAKKSRRKSLLTAGLFLGVGVGNKVLRSRAAQRVTEMNSANTLMMSEAKDRFDKSITFLSDYNQIMAAGKGNTFDESYKIWYRKGWLEKEGFTESSFRSNPESWNWLNERVDAATADDIAAYEQQYEIAKEFEGPFQPTQKWNTYSKGLENNMETLAELAGRDSDVGKRLMSIFRGNPKAEMETHHIGDHTLRLPEDISEDAPAAEFIKLLQGNLEKHKAFNAASGNFEYNDFNYDGYEALNLSAKRGITFNHRNANVITMLEDIRDTKGFNPAQYENMFNTFYNENGQKAEIPFSAILMTLSRQQKAEGQTISTLDQFLSSVQNIASLRQNIYIEMMSETGETPPPPTTTVLEAVDLLFANGNITISGKTSSNIIFTPPSRGAEWTLGTSNTPESRERFKSTDNRTGELIIPESIITDNERMNAEAVAAGQDSQAGLPPVTKNTVRNFLAESRTARSTLQYEDDRGPNELRKAGYTEVQIRQMKPSIYGQTGSRGQFLGSVPATGFGNIENTKFESIDDIESQARGLLSLINKGDLSVSSEEERELRSLAGDRIQDARTLKDIEQQIVAGEEVDEEDAIQSRILDEDTRRPDELTRAGYTEAQIRQMKPSIYEPKLDELDDGESFLESIGLPLTEEDKELWKSVVGPRWEGIKNAIREYDVVKVGDREREERIIPMTNELNETISNFVEDLWNKRPELNQEYGPRERMARLELLLAGITNSVLGYPKFGPETDEETAAILEVIRLKDMEEAGREGEVTEFQEREAEEARRDRSRTQRGSLLGREYTSRAMRVEDRAQQRIEAWEQRQEHSPRLAKILNAFLDTPLGPNSQKQLRDLFRNKFFDPWRT